jgi:hypothetical protein
VESLAIILGIIGVAINLTAYGLLSSERLRSDDARYQWMNIAGTTGLLISLMVQWNLASFVANVAWLVIGIFGLLRILRLRRA